MIEVMIVLVIILIIATFSIFSGRDTVNQATILEVYEEMLTMKEIANSINVKKDLDENFVLEKGVQYDAKLYENDSSGDTSTADELDDWYIIYGMDNLKEYNSSKVKAYYSLDTIKHSYVINFKTGKIELLDTVELSGNNVKTFEQIRSLAKE